MPVSAIDHHVTDYCLTQAYWLAHPGLLAGSPRPTGWLTQAYWLAQAAALAYQEPNVIVAEAQRWGFDRVRHHQTQFQPPFPLEDTQAYTMASDHMIITVFRGTEPAQIRDWLCDVNTRLSASFGTTIR